MNEDDSRVHLMRVHHQMLALFSRYAMSDKLLAQLECARTDGSGDNGLDRVDVAVRAILEIAANVSTYCRTVVQHSGTLVWCNSTKYLKILRNYL